MKIAIVRGDFASPWELQNFRYLTERHKLTLFTGLQPVADISKLDWLEVVKLPSPVDLNFGQVSRFTMALLNRIFVDAHYLLGLEKRLKGFDVVHCAETYYSYTQQGIQAKKLGYVKKVVSTVWENIPFNNENISGRKNYIINSFSNVDCFLAVTNGAKQALIAEGCPRGKISVLMPGVDQSIFCPHKTTHFKNIFKNKKVKLLFVGRLVPEKGITELLGIFSNLQKILNEIELVVVGTGPLKDKITGEGVKFIGQVSYEDMPKIFSICDIFVHYPIGSPTWQEQYGMVLIEAMATGLPVVSLDMGSIHEVVGDGGLVTNQEEMQETLLQLIIDKQKRNKLSNAAINRAQKNYNSLNYGQHVEAVYKRVLREAKGKHSSS